MNLLTKQRQINNHGKQIYGYQSGVWKIKKKKRLYTHTHSMIKLETEEAFMVFSTNSSSMLRFLLHSFFIASDGNFKGQLVLSFGNRLLKAIWYLKHQPKNI